MKKWARNAMLAAAFVGLAYTASRGIFTPYIFSGVKQQARSYADNSLAQLISQQEKKLGIRHSGMPRLSYGINPPICRTDTYVKTCGSYDPDTDTIHLNLDYATSPYNSFWDKIARAFFSACQGIDEVLSHEMGHFHNKKLAEGLGIDNLLDRECDPKEKEMAKEFVSEGIAEYFRIRTKGGANSRFFGNARGNRIDFEKAFDLVAPIIDQYKEKGIIYLLRNPPNSLSNLGIYQQKAMQVLAIN